MRESFWTREWFLGLILSLAAIIAAALGQFKYLDHALYGAATHFTVAAPTQRIAIISIDTKSLESLGPWPWPRSRIAELFRVIRPGHPKVIATTLDLTEPQTGPGLLGIRKLQNLYAQSTLHEGPSILNGVQQKIHSSIRLLGNQTPPPLKALGQELAAQAPLRKLSQSIRMMDAALNKLSDSLDTDKTLSQALNRSHNVALAMTYAPGITQGRPAKPLPATITRNLLSDLGQQHAQINPPTAYSIQAPMALFGKSASTIGFFSPAANQYGAIRHVPLVIKYYQHYLPSLGLLTALQSLNIPASSVTYKPNTGLIAGSLVIHTNNKLQIRPHFYAPGHNSGPITYSFVDILKGNISPDALHDKIVLLGLTAPSTVTPLATVSGVKEPPIFILADEISSILNQDAIYTPAWATWVVAATWALIIIFIIFVTQYLSNRSLTIISLLLASTILISIFYPITNMNIWIPLTGPLGLLLFSYLVVVSKRKVITGNRLIHLSTQSIENTRILALAFQEQGQLDLALDRLKQLPINDGTHELLYNLALDYERRRRFDKALDIYHDIQRHNRNYRDIKERLQQIEAILKSKTKRSEISDDTDDNAALMLGAAGLQKPVIGRYVVDKEIGRGAMSVVYQGRDPKIGRIVAIKTLPLNASFDQDELEKVKKRFYREAETAGRLSHPNIVTIYDAGEEHDLAYIAMEYLQGRNLTHFLHRKQLLPTVTILEIIAKCAFALDYAHRQKVIHRDIKPANIMYDIDKNTVKITDFGIARITDSSRTKTGSVMGTPSYMSPEQLAGHQLDGRSDLFSLGITCFQLLTGQLPFCADTMASLMYKITNEAHPALNSLCEDLEPCVSPIINKVLQKNPDKRFQSGRQMGQSLLRCAHEIRKHNS
ncbi:serine/threonine-protein kinase [Acidihalobacter ferrooxydans]|uniref:non-specific serine/threonine protein kinase n=1 Tax=Acidihalobacter ferrooxydans TaxID=1765967 RepID=A0A1P8UEG2_9GAMM|nr:serine/threonine-protein kinase [Acidihalobacter ferrooxydans]APZ42221.1 hypothetical protein BW247_03200 [Acidihalobacter ferrooxydans]